MRELKGLCRNGHDLEVHGKWSASKKRSLHIQCTECRRKQRLKENADKRARRAEGVAPAKGECEAGHPWSQYEGRTPNGTRFCTECRRFEAGLRMRRVYPERKPC